MGTELPSQRRARDEAGLQHPPHTHRRFQRVQRRPDDIPRLQLLLNPGHTLRGVVRPQALLQDAAQTLAAGAACPTQPTRRRTQQLRPRRAEVPLARGLRRTQQIADLGLANISLRPIARPVRVLEYFQLWST